MTFRLCSLMQCACCWAVLLPAFAAAADSPASPKIRNLSLRGLQSGATTQIVIDGDDLGPELRMILPVAIAKQEIQPGGNPKQLTLAITLDASVPAGIYPMRLGGPGGLSNAVPLAIDSLPQLAFTSDVENLPVALHGALTGSTTLRTSFPGRKGQRIVLDVESRRIGSKFDPVLHLYDSRGIQMAWDQATSAVSGDARIEIELPADGPYSVELHDAAYQAAAPGFFRLKIGTLHYADTVFPLAVRRGAESSLELVGTNVPPDQRVNIVAGELLTAAPVLWPPVVPFSGQRPEVVVTDLNEVVEHPPAEGVQEISLLPAAINGRIAAAKEEDTFRVLVSPGMKLAIDCSANRRGSPLDGVVTVRNAQGATLATSDDRPNMVDPGLDLTVPEGTTALTISIKDLVGRGGRDFVYRIAILPEPLLDLRLTTPSDSYAIPQGGTTLMRVRAERTGYDGPIKLNFSELAGGVVLTGDVIPAGSQQGLVSLTAPNVEPAQWIASVSGVGTGAPAALIRPVEAGSGDGYSYPRWLRNQVALAVVRPQPISIAWQGTSSGEKLTLGRRYLAKVKVARAADGDGAVRLSLVTSQVVPQKTVKKDDKEVKIDDVDRALRLDGEPVIEAGAAESQLALLVPHDLPSIPCDVAVQAELLSADGKVVRATAFTPAVRLDVVPPAASQPLAVFEDQLPFAAGLTEGKGELSLSVDDKYSGLASLKVTPERRAGAALPGLAIKIRQFPEDGEYRYVCFAWKKKEGQSIALEIAHDGKFGPEKDKGPAFRYHAGPGGESLGGSLAMSKELPADWVKVTRDLFVDFGEFTLTGIGLVAIDGQYALFDHLHLGRSRGDFELVAPKPAAGN